MLTRTDAEEQRAGRSDRVSGARYVYHLLLLAVPIAVGGLFLGGWPWRFAEPARAAACPWLRVAYAWVDADRDGVHGAVEAPLPGVRFEVDDREEELTAIGGGTGDAAGVAVVAIMNADCGASGARYVVRALPPPGYTALTPEQRGRGPGPLRFGFVPSAAPAGP